MAHPPVHIKICAGGCNAVDGPKDKKDGLIISCRDPNDVKDHLIDAFALFRSD